MDYKIRKNRNIKIINRIKRRTFFLLMIPCFLLFLLTSISFSYYLIILGIYLLLSIKDFKMLKELKKERDAMEDLGWKIKEIHTDLYFEINKTLKNIDTLYNFKGGIVAYKRNMLPIDYYTKTKPFINKNIDYFKDFNDKRALSYSYLQKLKEDRNYYDENSGIEPFIESLESLNDEFFSLQMNYEEEHELLEKEFQGVLNIFKGREMVNKELSSFSDIFINKQDINLDIGNRIITCDNLLLTPYGIYALYVYNLGDSSSFSIEVEREGSIKKISNNGNSEICFKNIGQRANYFSGLKEHLFDAKHSKKRIKVHPLIVIADQDSSIVNKSHYPVARITDVYNEITRGSKPDIYTLDELKELEKIIEEHDTGTLQLELTDVERFFEDLNTKIEKIDKFNAGLIPVIKETQKIYNRYDRNF